MFVGSRLVSVHKTADLVGHVFFSCDALYRVQICYGKSSICPSVRIIGVQIIVFEFFENNYTTVSLGSLLPSGVFSGFRGTHDINKNYILTVTAAAERVMCVLIFKVK